MQLRVLPNVGPLSVTSTHAEETRAVDPLIRAEDMVDAGRSRPLVAGDAAPPQVRSEYVAARIEISNGNGVRGSGARLGQSLRFRHAAVAVRLSNMPRFDLDATVVEYRPGFAREAQMIASSLEAATLIHPTQTGLKRSDIRILLGRDLKTAMTCVACTPGKSRVNVVAGLQSSPSTDH